MSKPIVLKNEHHVLTADFNKADNLVLVHWQYTEQRNGFFNHDVTFRANGKMHIESTDYDIYVDGGFPITHTYDFERFFYDFEDCFVENHKHNNDREIIAFHKTEILENWPKICDEWLDHLLDPFLCESDFGDHKPHCTNGTVDDLKTILRDILQSAPPDELVTQRNEIAVDTALEIGDDPPQGQCLTELTPYCTNLSDIALAHFRPVGATLSYSGGDSDRRSGYVPSPLAIIVGIERAPSPRERMNASARIATWLRSINVSSDVVSR